MMKREFDGMEDYTLRTAEVHSVVSGVTIPWLMKAFRMGRGTIEKKMIGCKSIGTGKHNTPIYDLPEAAAYLVTPRMDVDKYLQGIKPDQLPERLRESYWNAMLKRQRWEEKARHLWRDEDVLNTFSEIFKLVRTSLQLLPDRIDEANGIDEPQRLAITLAIDEVQDEMHREIVRRSTLKTTPSQISEVSDDDTEPEDDDDIFG
jgi:Protein of unknown function (DUF1441)